MNTLVIYDELGAVISTMTGREYGLVGTAVIDLADGYEITGVDVETGEVLTAPRPATEKERTAAIEKQLMQEAAAHSGSYEDPIPFVYGMALKEGGHYRFAGEVYRWNAADCAAGVWLPDSGIWQWQKAAAAAAGTAADPIPAERGMEYIYGRYYLDPEDDGIYLCARTGEAEGGKIALNYLPHELIGQYFSA